MKKHIFSVALVILLAGCMCAVGWNRKPAQSFKPNQEAVLSIYSAEKDCTEEIPLKIEDGTLYECTDGKTWNPIALDGQASEVFSGEHLCVLMEDGRMISDFPTEEELLGSGEEVPLTLGYVVYMADQAREINKSEPFVSINQTVEALGFRALLQSGEIICQNDGDDVYSCYQLPEETPKMLAGDYILTEQGNVWYMNERMDVEKVYDGGDIIAVSPTQMPGHCMGYTQNEQTVEW